MRVVQRITVGSGAVQPLLRALLALPRQLIAQCQATGRLLEDHCGPEGEPTCVFARASAALPSPFLIIPIGRYVFFRRRVREQVETLTWHSSHSVQVTERQFWLCIA